MIYIDSNTALRNGYLAALIPALGIPGWAKKVPVSETVPVQYFLIHSQTLNTTERSKDCFEWLCSIVVDVIYSGPPGFASPIKTETLEAAVITLVEAGIIVQGFDLKSQEFQGSINLDEETPTQSIERRVITYQHWLCQTQETT